MAQVDDIKMQDFLGRFIYIFSVRLIFRDAHKKPKNKNNTKKPLIVRNVGPWNKLSRMM